MSNCSAINFVLNETNNLIENIDNVISFFFYKFYILLEKKSFD